MSDPFSIATGAAGIISLGLTAAQGLFQIADGIGSAGQEVRSYAEEINTFSKLLRHVKDELEISTGVSADIQSLVNDVVHICGRVLKPLDALQKTLRPLLEHFRNSPSKIQQLGLRLQWLFRKKAKVLFYRAALKEQHRILDTILENSMAAVSLSHRERQPMDFKICFEEAASNFSDRTLSNNIKPTERKFNAEDIYEAGSEYNAALVPFPAILHDYSEELTERDLLIVSGCMERHLDSESHESAQEIWYDICASQRKVLRLASCLLRSEGEFEADVNMLSPKSYTVGWICTGIMEYVAAQAFLDVRHKMTNVAPNDDNIYTLGLVGEHNVVMAVVAGQGLATAASVAAGMKHSFPNIQIGLVVGIGGGVPSEWHDIRLGDVVVSVPGKGMGGVMQYDLGRATKGQLDPTGFINQPPYILQVAVTSLRAKFVMDGNFLDETVTRILDETPRLREKYCRPEQSSDVLYQHCLGPHKTNAPCECSPLLRYERKPDEDKVAVHFGLIASGNLAMKDSSVRDQLSSEKDVLCFDTTAAGVMNHFPCLVIHGMYDYSDSHRYIQWEGYAAMTAAAYARELLCHIAPKVVS